MDENMETNSVDIQEFGLCMMIQCNDDHSIEDQYKIQYIHNYEKYNLFKSIACYI